MTIDNLYEYINMSRFVTIGYNAMSERLKDGFISGLPTVSLSEIDPSFSLNLKSIMRDNRLNYLLGNDFNQSLMNPKKDSFLLINYSDLNLPKNSNLSNSANLSLFLEKIKDSFSDYKIIFTTFTNRRPDDSSNNYLGGNKPIYVSDLVFSFNQDNINIYKNRFGSTTGISNIKLTNSKEYEISE